MSKKLIVLILFVFLLISTVLISLFGKNPDPPIVRVNEIVFQPNIDDKYYYNEEGILIVTIDITDLKKTGDKYVINYELNCLIKPENAANKMLVFTIYDEAKKQFVEFSSDGLMTITLKSKVSTDFEVYAKSADAAVSAQSKIIIYLHVDQKDNPW